MKQTSKIKTALKELVAYDSTLDRDLRVCVVYHADCNDGITSAAVVLHYLKETFTNCKYKLEAATYGDPFDAGMVDSYDACFIVDFSFKGNQLVELCAKLASVFVFDHHKTAIESLDTYFSENPMPGNLYLELSQEEGVAGANLTWAMLDIDETRALKHLVDDVSDRDTWRFTRPSSKKAHLGLVTLPKCTPEIVQSSYIAEGTFAYDNYVDLLESGASAQRMWNMSLEKLAKTTTQHTMVLGKITYQVHLTNCHYVFISDLADLIMSRDTFDNDSICCMFTIRQHDVKLSFRSKNGTAKQVAEFLGGGGHPNAAGTEGVSLAQLGSMFDNFQNH